MATAPRTLSELAARAAQLVGRPLSELGDVTPPHTLVRRKGMIGQLIERALGAHAGSAPLPDFTHLGVELKTIPVDPQGKPLESTFVCTLPLREADTLEWEDSPVQKKLAHVLWVPIVVSGGDRRVGEPLFWQPTAEQQGVLRADFEEIVGLVAIGKIEWLNARLGRWLQARPKAAHSRVRTRAFGEGGEPLEALPRGFYLRARFTEALLRDPTTLAGAG